MLCIKFRSEYLFLISNCGILVLKRTWAKLIVSFDYLMSSHKTWKQWMEEGSWQHACPYMAPSFINTFHLDDIYGVPSKCQASYTAQGCMRPGYNGKDGSDQIQGMYGRYSKALVIDLEVKNEAQEDLKANFYWLAEKQWKRRRFSWVEWIQSWKCLVWEPVRHSNEDVKGTKIWKQFHINGKHEFNYVKDTLYIASSHKEF